MPNHTASQIVVCSTVGQDLRVHDFQACHIVRVEDRSAPQGGEAADHTHISWQTSVTG